MTSEISTGTTWRARLQPASGGWRAELLGLAVLAALLTAYYLSPNLPLAGVATIALIAAVWWLLEAALPLVVVLAPFYRFPKALELPWGSRAAPFEISLAEYLLLVCLAAWLLRWVQRPATASAPAPTPRRLWLPPLALIAVAVLSLVFTRNLQVALRELRVVIVEPGLYYLLLLHTFGTPLQVLKCLALLAAAGAGIAVYGLYHYIFVGVVEATGGVRRILAIYHSPNALALYLGRVIPVAVALALAERPSTGSGRGRWWSAAALASAALMVVVFYLTFSRGAFLGLGAALMLLLFIWRPRVALIAVGALAVALLASLPFLPLDRLLQLTPLAQRLYVWQAALQMAFDYPFTGVGLDNFLYYYPQYMLPAAALEPDISHPHNLILDFWLRLGILGLVLLAWLQEQFWRMSITVLRQMGPSWQRWLVLALMASMLDFLVHGLIDNSYFLIDLAYLFWFTYALVAILYRGLHRSNPPSTT